MASDTICLPRSALTDDLWRNPDLGRLLLYLMSKADSNGEAVIDSGEIYRALGFPRQRFRTLLGKLANNHLLTTLPTTNATTIKFDTQQVKPKRQPPKKPPCQPLANHLFTKEDDYVDPLFAEAWELWLNYRKEINNNYKTEQSKRIGYEQLLKKSDNDPQKAIEMVRDTIANGYKGLFPSRTYGAKPITTADNAASRKAQRDRGLSLATAIVARSENLLSLYNGEGGDSDARQN